MTSRRLLLAHVLIAGVVGGSFYDIVTRQEHWPFSNYPMFSTVHRSTTLRWLRLYGVTADDREVPVVKYSYLFPLDQSRLPLGLRRYLNGEDGNEKLKEAVVDALRRYEQRRLAHEHAGPALRALRLYQVRWDVRPYAANLEQPASRELLAEARAGEAP
jgi:hypothetical protein